MRKNLLNLDISIASELKYMIESGLYAPDEKLPSERKLCETFNVQRMTVRSALDILIKENYVYAIPKSGYYVAPPRIVQSIRHLGFDAEHNSRALQLKSDLLDFKKISAETAIANKLLIPSGSPVFKIVRLFQENHTPIQISTAYIPADLCPKITRPIAQSRSPKDIVRSFHLDITKTAQKITRVYANEREASLLAVPLRTSLLKHRVAASLPSGRLVLLCEDVMLYHRFSFFKEAVPIEH